MRCAVGVDTSSVARIEKALCGVGFKERVFTEREREYCDGKADPVKSYAGIFCAKEAAAKAAKLGFGKGIMPSDIEIIHNTDGAPMLNARGNALPIFSRYDSDVSISHDGDYAVAVVVLTARLNNNRG